VGEVTTWILRWGYRAASSLLFVYRFVFRPSLSGVRCVLRRGDEVLLVRHTYGSRDWALPGGGIKRGEDPAATARREMAEELGVDIADWRPIGELRFTGIERARHTVFCFVGELPDDGVEVNGVEIAEARLHPVDRLPDVVVRGTREVVKRAWDA
jgi:8-oxo-dGTP pyrophosphatase MutT (NUDIX family)